MARHSGPSNRAAALRSSARGAKVRLPEALRQTIVADGQTLWLYDVDLNQVTQRAQAQALGSTPAALLASAPDMAALRCADYALEAAPEQDGLQWVQATPKARDGQLKSACAWASRATSWPHWTFWTALASVRRSASRACSSTRSAARGQLPVQAARGADLPAAAAAAQVAAAPVGAAITKASEKQKLSSRPWAMKAGTAVSTMRTEPHR